MQGRSRKTALPVTLKMNVFLRVGHILKLQFRHYRASVDYHKDNIPQNPAIFQRLCNEVGSRSLSRLFTVRELTQHGASKHEKRITKKHSRDCGICSFSCTRQDPPDGECGGNLSLSELHHVAATSRTPWPPSLPSKIHYSPSFRPSGTVYNKECPLRAF